VVQLPAVRPVLRARNVPVVRVNPVLAEVRRRDVVDDPQVDLNVNVNAVVANDVVGIAHARHDNVIAENNNIDVHEVELVGEVAAVVDGNIDNGDQVNDEDVVVNVVGVLAGALVNTCSIN